MISLFKPLDRRMACTVIEKSNEILVRDFHDSRLIYFVYIHLAHTSLSQSRIESCRKCAQNTSEPPTYRTRH